MFYNTPLRLRALNNKTEEHHRAAAIAREYSLQYPYCGLTLRKHGTAAEMKTQGDSWKATVGAYQRGREHDLVSPQDSDDNNAGTADKSLTSTSNSWLYTPMSLCTCGASHPSNSTKLQSRLHAISSDFGSEPGLVAVTRSQLESFNKSISSILSPLKDLALTPCPSLLSLPPAPSHLHMPNTAINNIKTAINSTMAKELLPIGTWSLQKLRQKYWNTCEKESALRRQELMSHIQSDNQISFHASSSTSLSSSSSSSLPLYTSLSKTPFSYKDYEQHRSSHTAVIPLANDSADSVAKALEYNDNYTDTDTLPTAILTNMRLQSLSTAPPLPLPELKEAGFLGDIPESERISPSHPATQHTNALPLASSEDAFTIYDNEGGMTCYRDAYHRYCSSASVLLSRVYDELCAKYRASVQQNLDAVLNELIMEHNQSSVDADSLILPQLSSIVERDIPLPSFDYLTELCTCVKPRLTRPLTSDISVAGDETLSSEGGTMTDSAASSSTQTRHFDKTQSFFLNCLGIPGPLYIPPNNIGLLIKGYVSNVNYTHKSGSTGGSNLVLFINNRLVTSSIIKKMVDAIYAEILPKNATYWGYISLQLPAYNLDVNVHPTKKEVHFLHQEQILSLLSQALRTALTSSNQSRLFTAHTVTLQSSLLKTTSFLQADDANYTSRDADGEPTVVHDIEDEADVDERSGKSRVRKNASYSDEESDATEAEDETTRAQTSINTPGKRKKRNDEESVASPYVATQLTSPTSGKSQDKRTNEPKKVAPWLMVRTDSAQKSLKSFLIPVAKSGTKNTESSNTPSNISSDLTVDQDISSDLIMDHDLDTTSITSAQLPSTSSDASVTSSSSSSSSSSSTLTANSASPSSLSLAQQYAAVISPIASVFPHLSPRTDASDAAEATGNDGSGMLSSSSTQNTLGRGDATRTPSLPPVLLAPILVQLDSIKSLKQRVLSSLHIDSFGNPENIANSWPPCFGKASHIFSQATFVGVCKDIAPIVHSGAADTRSDAKKDNNNNGDRNIENSGDPLPLYFLFQSARSLFLADIRSLSYHFFYRMILQYFANQPYVALAEPIPVKPLITAVIQAKTNLPVDLHHVDKCCILLLEKAPMLQEYFSLGFEYLASNHQDAAQNPSEDPEKEVFLTFIPELCPNYIPPLAKLPLFLLHLAEKVDWTAELPCFEGVAKALAAFYAVEEAGYILSDGAPGGSNSASQRRIDAETLLEHIIGTIVLPHMKKHKFVPPSVCFGTGGVVEVACLEDLYKIFERC